MINLQQLVTWAKAEKEKAQEECLKHPYTKSNEIGLRYRLIYCAFSGLLSNAELLLKYENENSSQSSPAETSNSSNAM